jgi:hypothetical protein
MDMPMEGPGPSSVPGWLGPLLVTLFVVTTLACVSGVAHHRTRHGWGVAASGANHVVMGAAMIAMTVPTLSTLVPAAVGLGMSGACAAAWLVALTIRRARGELGGPGLRCGAHPMHLALLNGAMAAMYAAMLPAGPAATGHAGHAAHGTAAATSLPPGLVAAAAVLALYVVVHAVATGATLVTTSGIGVVTATGRLGRLRLLPRLVVSDPVQLFCQAASGAGMGVSLLLMV